MPNGQGKTANSGLNGGQGINEPYMQAKRKEGEAANAKLIADLRAKVCALHEHRPLS